MQSTIPVVTIVFMAISALFGLAVPTALYVYFRKKKKANHLPFWVGCVTFVLFALVLEQLMYSFLMKTPVWMTISGNVWLYGIVGGFFAGLFEESGRYLAFKTVLRKKRGNDANALMYGAGHGGIEAVILLSVTMVINVIFSLQYNAGIPSQLGTLDAGQQLINTPSWMFLVGAVERLSAVAIHISLSVLVWFAAKNNKRFWLFPLAILLHLLVDAVAVVLSGLGVNVWIIEGAVYVIAAALIVIAILVWKKNHVAEQPAVSLEEAPAEAQAQ
ncbi:MAG: YhfC family intramembrane metalloprotease [Eubacteriales bacterium]|nr:YhfC family intramembrane metalloprotease [Eubacteriales bacterium]